MLCALIGLLVIKIEVKEKKEFKLFFGGNSSISINLDTNNPEIVAEIAIFQDTVDGSLYVFE